MNSLMERLDQLEVCTTPPGKMQRYTPHQADLDALARQILMGTPTQVPVTQLQTVQDEIKIPLKTIGVMVGVVLLALTAIASQFKPQVAAIAPLAIQTSSSATETPAEDLTESQPAAPAAAICNPLMPFEGLE